MTDFLLLLGKLNLAMGAAIIVVWLLRRPLRAWFGAPVAYALWLLVPIAGIASLLPPRVAAPLPAYVMHLQNPAVQNLAGQYPAAQMPVTMPIAQPAPRIPEQLTEHIAPVQSMISAKTASLDSAFPDHAALLFAVWTLGAVLMALYLARLQVRFHATMRLGEAGPAVLGFFRPRLVMPDTFEEQFTAAEQAAILAHERVHLARQDARINALAALLRCLCWFNPLVHLGAASMRIDQELACDATALTGPVSRRDYANALLKSQMMVTLLPLGCNWPGSQHPLVERIALLKRKRPGTARRIAGTGLVMVAAISAGLSAWAAQPPVPAKFIAVPHNQIALTTPPVANPAPGQNAGEPVTDANPVAGGDAAKNDQVTKPIDAVVPPEMPKVGSAGTQSALPAIQVPDQKIDLALNEATGAALAKDAADASSALSDRTVAQQMAATGTTTTSAASPVALGSPAAPKQTGNSPRPETRAALYCMLELGPKDCQEMFAAGGVRDWALNFWIRPNAKGDFERGPLKSVVYVGQSSGIVGGGTMDVYRVTFAHLVWTISIQQPESDGKIHHVDTSNPWVDPPANAAANSVSATPLDGQQAHNENLALKGTSKNIHLGHFVRV